MAEDFDSPELEVKVTTSADLAGTDAAAKGLEEVSQSGGGATHALRELTGTSRHTSEIFRGIEAAGRGGAVGIGEMVRGLRALIIVASEAIGATGLGGLALVLGGLLGAFIAFGRHTHDAATGMKEAGSEAETLKKRLDEIKTAAEQDFKGLLSDLKELNDQFKDLNERISAATTAADRNAKADRDLRDSARDLAEQREKDAAKSPEEIAYIEKKYGAQKNLDHSNDELLDSKQKLLDLTVKQNAAEDEAAKKADIAAQGAGKVAEAQSAFDAAKKASGVAVSQLADTITAARARAREEEIRQILLGPIGMTVSQFLAHPEQGADTSVAARARAHEAETRLTAAKGEQEKLQKEADESARKVEAARKAVAEEQTAATKENTAALNRVATAILQRQDVDKPEITAGGETAESAQKQADTEAKKVVVEKTREDTKLTKEMAEAAKIHNELHKELHRTVLKGHEILLSNHREIKKLKQQSEAAQTFQSP